MIDIFSFSFILLYAALFGFTMKTADLFDEHEMRWFKDDAVLFGLLWGFFGALLVLARVDIANIILAMILAFLVRMKLDYRNHAIAGAIIVIVFLWKSTFDLTLFLIFFINFITFGSLKDYMGDIRKKKDWLYKVFESGGWLYYAIPTAIYGWLTNNWIVFFTFVIFVIFYDLTKCSLYRMKQYHKL